MSVNQKQIPADFHVTTYGREPYDTQEGWSNAPSAGAATGGGLPWFHKRPSPYDPNLSTEPTMLPGIPNTMATPYPTSMAPDAPGTSATGTGDQFLGMSPATFAALAGALMQLFGGLKGNQNNLNPSSLTNDPNITAALAAGKQRMDYQQPLFESVQRLAMGLLPTAYQSPMGMTSTATPKPTAPSVTPPGYQDPSGRDNPDRWAVDRP